MAVAIDSGSECPTRRPAPLERSSTACGNGVATTGMPAATASESTPEVACSCETYGSRTRSAVAMRRAQLRSIEIPVVERDDVLQAELRDDAPEAVAVALALVREHLGVRLTGDDVFDRECPHPGVGPRHGFPTPGPCLPRSGPRSRTRLRPRSHAQRPPRAVTATPCGMTATFAARDAVLALAGSLRPRRS